MLQVEIKETYADILYPLQDHVDEAMRRYALETVQTRLFELEDRVQQWVEKYGCSYDLFVYRLTTDETYVDQLNSTPKTQLWDSDLLAWEFDVKDLQVWQQHYLTVLPVSPMRKET